MSFTVAIPLTNPGPTPQKVTVPKGTLVQVNAPGFQNVVLSDTVTAVVPPNQTVHVKVPALCVNQTLGPPNGVPGNVTGAVFPRLFATQQDVWNTLAQPATPPNPVTMPTSATTVNLKEICDAFTGAFDASSLGMMLDFAFGKQLFNIVSNGPFDEVVYDLLIRSHKEGWQKDLVGAAHRFIADQHPAGTGNPALHKVYRAFGF